MLAWRQTSFRPELKYLPLWKKPFLKGLSQVPMHSYFNYCQLLEVLCPAASWWSTVWGLRSWVFYLSDKFIGNWCSLGNFGLDSLFGLTCLLYEEGKRYQDREQTSQGVSGSVPHLACMGCLWSPCWVCWELRLAVLRWGMWDCSSSNGVSAGGWPVSLKQPRASPPYYVLNPTGAMKLVSCRIVSSGLYPMQECFPQG